MVLTAEAHALLFPLDELHLCHTQSTNRGSQASQLSVHARSRQTHLHENSFLSNRVAAEN